LVGIGEGSTQRQAKINCARNALQNIEEGKKCERAVPQEGLLAYLRDHNDVQGILQDFDPAAFSAHQKRALELTAEQRLREEENRKRRGEEEERSRKRNEKELSKVGALKEKMDEKER
jgi:hypothetical protein